MAMTKANIAVLSAGASLALVAGFVSAAIVDPRSTFVGGALVAMALLAGSIHAMGRTHTGS